MTTILDSREQVEENRVKFVWAELEHIEQKTPKVHKSIVTVLYNQQKLIDTLLKDNKFLWRQIQTYKKNEKDTANNADSTQVIMKRIWDNKEDEFWDTF